MLEAQIRLAQGRADDALVLLNAPEVAFPVDGDLAIKRNLLSARANRSLEHAQEADRQLQQAHALADASHSELSAEVLHDEAMIELDAGNFEQAREKLAKSLVLARRLSDPWQRTADLIDLGYSTFKSGHFDQALAFSQEAATLARSIAAPNLIQLAEGHVGWEYLNLGEFELALSHFREAQHWAQEAGKTGRQIIWLEDAGLTQFKLGNLQEARKYDDEALQAALRLGTPDGIDTVVNLQVNEALLLYTQGQYEAARRYSDAAAQSARNSKDDQVIAYAGFMNGLIATQLSNRVDAQNQLLQARERTPDPETRMEIENALGNLNAGAHQSQQAEQWYRRSIDTFEHNRSSIQSEALRLSSFAYGDSIYRDYAQFLLDEGRAGEALTVLDGSRARTLEEGLGFAPETSSGSNKPSVSPEAVARRVNASILFYSLGRDRSYLWAITAHGTRLFTLPSRQNIESLVERYQRAIQSSGDPLQTAATTGAALYDALVAPAQALLPSGSHVYLIPDGALVGLNFETLMRPSSDGMHYWIEDATLTTTSSIRILSRRQAAQQGPSKSLLLMGDPLAASEQFQALSHAADEIQRVRQHFPSQEQVVLTQSNAVPASYAASGLERFGYLHFVAHGTASRQSPLESAVILSPPTQTPEDFKLYARDIVQHPLHARLVTVSACYSSGVRAYAGEGLVGLSWAFLRAGAHNVIGALWDVNDDSTPRLMDALYGELESGQTPDAALRTAKLSLLHSSGVYRRPYYWAAFQLYAGS